MVGHRRASAIKHARMQCLSNVLVALIIGSQIFASKKVPIYLVIALLGAQAKATQAMSEGVLNTRGIQAHLTCEFSRHEYSHQPKCLGPYLD